MILEIGCGENPITADTPDIETKSIDYRMDAVGFDCVEAVGLTTHIPFLSNSLDGIVCQHVIEHHTHESFGDNPNHGTLLQFLKECFRVLKTGGFVESMCPNFAYIAKAYCQHGITNPDFSRQLMQWAMGGQRDKWDYHYALLDFNILGDWARMAGFSNITLLHPFDWFGLHVRMEK